MVETWCWGLLHGWFGSKFRRQSALQAWLLGSSAAQTAADAAVAFVACLPAAFPQAFVLQLAAAA